MQSRPRLLISELAWLHLPANIEVIQYHYHSKMYMLRLLLLKSIAVIRDIDILATHLQGDGGGSLLLHALLFPEMRQVPCQPAQGVPECTCYYHACMHGFCEQMQGNLKAANI